jgi:glucose-6-phosphate 1-dehydrogenase
MGEFAMDQQFQDSFPAASRFLQTCEVLTTDIKVEPFALVLFGGTGDLSKRMLLPSLYHLNKDGRLPEDFAVFAFGLPKRSRETQILWRGLCAEDHHEKPFGRDTASASELNRTVLSVFNENQIYRVDHYLSKEING